MSRRIVGLLSTALITFAPPLAAQEAEWPTYGHDKGGQRHSPLDQITPENVASLVPAWTYHMRPQQTEEEEAQAELEAQRAAEEGVRPSFFRQRSRFSGSQATPLVVDGRMYVSTPYGRVVALDPETGAEIWVTEIEGPGDPSLRGVEYWPGDAETAPRIVFGTRDGRLIALDAATGAFAAEFGDNGIVEMKTPEILNGAEARFYGMTSPPIVFENLIITGSAVQEFPPIGVAGDVRAWDARTGELVWTFHSVPREGEPGYETWEPGSAEGRSGVNVWGFLTVDAERGIVYMPFGAPSFDRYGGDRKGDNLYGTSIVAADARTGEHLWHFQVVRHDIWDNDLQAPPLLLDVEKDGETVPSVAVVSKNALLFVLNRVTGEPVFPIEDREFPASDVPGEVAAPTQPVPTITPPLARTSFSFDEIATVTPEHYQACSNWIAENDMVAGGLYDPVKFNRVTISFPGLQGGANWGGAAYDPARKLLIVNTNDLGQVTALVPTENGPLPYERGLASGRFKMEDTNLLCQEPPWGRLSAVDMTTGEIAWQVRLGVTDSLPEDVRNTGRPNIGGAITTASGVTFIGATDDGRFRAFDSQSGATLWETTLDASAHATPITYQGASGRQFVTVTATGGSFLRSPLESDTIVAFALPAAE